MNITYPRQIINNIKVSFIVFLNGIIIIKPKTQENRGDAGHKYII